MNFNHYLTLFGGLIRDRLTRSRLSSVAQADVGEMMNMVLFLSAELSESLL